LSDSQTFLKLKENVKWLEKNLDKDYSLNLQKFTAEQKAIRAIYKDLDSLIKLPVDLNVAAVGKASIVADQDKDEKTKQFVNRIRDDIYVDETVKVINNIIGQVELAKATGTK
jgi:carboxyl-terminal processing protease